MHAQVLFVAATVALEGAFLWTALQQDGAGKVDISWFIAVPGCRSYAARYDLVPIPRSFPLLVSHQRFGGQAKPSCSC